LNILALHDQAILLPLYFLSRRKIARRDSQKGRN
jgi:hypothetical protein